MNELVVFYGSGLVVSLLGVVLVIVALSYHKALREIKALRSENDNLKKQGSALAQDELARAREQAHTIVSQADTKASTIVSQADVFSSQVKQQFSTDLTAIVKKEEIDFEGLQKQIHESAIQILQEISNSIKSDTHKSVEEFQLALSVEMKKSQDQVRQSIEAGYANVKREVDAYQLLLMTQVEKQIYEIVRTTAKKVIGSSLSIEEHQELIIKALEEAKREHIL
ncbi:hypothetical protein A2801_03075 [Candidatus Woesebacteria bacterium RIFCSPHIGHO2_01_FULL_41_10]|uniref:Uncharacterized protein n=1 Tax=Candidatus Woesebacteria bacterium RIFCSPHIGHO2_01_FULL_41_10 TaxID=1802500 RepID=A0A1F7YLI8_9BACT|nr:MAG: hypothetical protein A2801_03075 [Candidatus Woesebacteria bacterium RIFCSPHIGHO2_01_FULL_41_10]